MLMKLVTITILEYVYAKPLRCMPLISTAVYANISQ